MLPEPDNALDNGLYLRNRTSLNGYDDIPSPGLEPNLDFYWDGPPFQSEVQPQDVQNLALRLKWAWAYVWDPNPRNV